MAVKIFKPHVTTTKLTCLLTKAGAVAYKTDEGTIHIAGDPVDLLDDPAATRDTVILKICGECLLHTYSCSPVAPEGSNDWQIPEGSTSLQNSVYGINRKL